MNDLKTRNIVEYYQIGSDVAWNGPARCPYCLEKLQSIKNDLSQSAKPPLGPPPGSAPGLGTSKASSLTGGSGDSCPLCRHDIPLTIRGVAPHALNRPQQWDYLDNDLEYRLKAEGRDVESYIFAMGAHYNPDYMEAKERYMEKVFERKALLRVREEMLEAEGDLTALMAGYLRKRQGGESGLALHLLAGEKWRQWACGLSAEGASPRLIAEFQLDYVQHLSWGVFESLRLHEEAIRYLKDRLDQLDGA